MRLRCDTVKLDTPTDFARASSFTFTPLPALSRPPMDFSTWFEVYLQGHWCTFDARHNRRRIGRVLIGRGLDAADVTLEVFRVITEEIDLTAVSDLSMTQPSGRSQSEIAGARSYNNEHVL